MNVFTLSLWENFWWGLIYFDQFIWKTVVFNVTNNNPVAEQFPLQCNNNKVILIVCC